ncbi:hypothetical protein [Burkholderia sp. RF7-non_BP4]|uniref:hypothetical protein n=1 Tax=unclassified Burkholderia TaxID=2613784 RepID=UPI00359C9267
MSSRTPTCVLPVPLPTSPVSNASIATRSRCLDACARAAAHGFMRVSSFNLYWDASGQTFQDADGYRTVLLNAGWR